MTPFCVSAEHTITKEYPEFKMKLWDVGSTLDYRDFKDKDDKKAELPWRYGVIYVIDSSDESKFEEGTPVACFI